MSNNEEKFDAIIIGAGPAGSACAWTLAKAGLSVVMLERGKHAGSKNLFGGILFSTVLNKLIPNFWEEAPVERHIVRRRFGFLIKDADVGFDFRSEQYNSPPFNNSFSVLRSKFDEWFAKKAEETGAELFSGVVVDDFIYEGEKITGIKARGAQEGEYDELYADVVVCAEGANSMLAEKAGLRKEKSLMTAKNRASAVKEIIELPREVIEERFHLIGSEGVSIEYYGDSVRGLVGSGFIYTNKDSISVGVGCGIQEYIDSNISSYDQLDYFKAHPAIKPLIRGGKVVEYSTHMLPEDTYGTLPELVRDGLILAGDSAGLINNSFQHEATNLAMASGVCAAETIIEAKKKNDFSKAGLASYRKKLEESFVLKDMKHFRNFLPFIHKHREFLTKYPDIAVGFLIDYFTITDKPKPAVIGELFERFRTQANLFKLAKDMWEARGSLL